MILTRVILCSRALLQIALFRPPSFRARGDHHGSLHSIILGPPPSPSPAPTTPPSPKPPLSPTPAMGAINRTRARHRKTVYRQMAAGGASKGNDPTN